jgi:hypothetical protein
MATMIKGGDRFGAGSPFNHDSPNNPYGGGWRIEGLYQAMLRRLYPRKHM